MISFYCLTNNRQPNSPSDAVPALRLTPVLGKFNSGLQRLHKGS